jgi:subfamily B ATP-binding cassette protein MsbA
MGKNRLLLKFALRHRFSIILSIIFGFSGSIFNGVSTTLIAPIVLSVLDENIIPTKALPPIISKPMSLFDIFSGDLRIFLMLLTIFMVIILKNINNIISIFINSDFSRKLSISLREEIFKLLMEVDLDYFNKNKVGTLLSNIGGNAELTAGSITTFLGILNTSFTLLIYFAILISISWQLTLITLCLLYSLTLINKIFIKRAKNLGNIARKININYHQKVIDIFTGIRLVKSVSQEQQEYNNLRELLKQREKASIDSQMNSIFIQPINEIGGLTIILAIIIIGRYFFFEQMQSIAAVLLTYLLVLFRAIPLVGSLNSARTSFANNSSSVEMIYAFLSRDDKPFLVRGSEPYLGLKQGFKFDNVSFAYPGYKNLVIKNLNMSIPKGKMTALVGSSGSGKSTIADLVARFYDPTEGRILIDGQDYRALDLKSMRKVMGMVSQDTFLFSNTVRYNICYGLDDVREEQLIDAAKRANAYDFIIQLPQQFETEIGERGVMLSGGQRQRLAIARALLRNPEILILDEATSALDTVSERLVQQAIDELSQERTTLVIAHRLSTVQKADQIVVLDGGEVMEIGTHAELLAKNGYFAQLYKAQILQLIKQKSKPRSFN